MLESIRARVKPMRTATVLLVSASAGTRSCWPADLPEPDEQMRLSWSVELNPDPAPPVRIGVSNPCVVWLLDARAKRLQRWDCAGNVLPAVEANVVRAPAAAAVLTSMNGSVALWDGKLRAIARFGPNTSHTALGTGIADSMLVRAFLDESTTLHCADRLGARALKGNHIELIVWRGDSSDWLELRQLQPVAPGALPTGAGTILLPGLQQSRTRCFLNRNSDVAVAWTDEPHAFRSDSIAHEQRGDSIAVLRRLQASASVERVPFAGVAYDHARDALWFLQYRLRRPRTPQFLVSPKAANATRQRVGIGSTNAHIESMAVNAGNVFVVMRLPSGRYELRRYSRDTASASH